MAYESIPLTEDIHIDQLYTVHYFEYRSDFSYPESDITSGNSSAWTKEVQRFRQMMTYIF